MEEEGVAEIMMDENATAQVARPGTSFARPNTSASRAGGGVATGLSSFNQGMRPMTRAGAPMTGFARPATAARPSTGSSRDTIETAFRGSGRPGTSRPVSSAARLTRLGTATQLSEPGGAFYTLVPIRPRSRGERRFLTTLPGASLRPGSLAFNPDTPRCLSTPLLTPLNSTPTSLRMERPSEDPWGLYALFGAFVPAEHRATHAKHVDALQRMARERGGVGGGGGGDTAYTAAGERKRARVDDAGPAGPSGLRCVLYTSPHTTALAW